MDTPENTAKIADLTVGEPDAPIREAMGETVGEPAPPPTGQLPSPLDIPPLHLPPGHPALTIISREEMYGDDGRD